MGFHIVFKINCQLKQCSWLQCKSIVIFVIELTYFCCRCQALCWNRCLLPVEVLEVLEEASLLHSFPHSTLPCSAASIPLIFSSSWWVTPVACTVLHLAGQTHNTLPRVLFVFFFWSFDLCFLSGLSTASATATAATTAAAAAAEPAQVPPKHTSTSRPPTGTVFTSFFCKQDSIKETSYCQKVLELNWVRSQEE